MSEKNTAGGAPKGFAGWTVSNFINSPLTPLLFLASIFIGIVGILITPRQEDPQISVPMVDIFVAYPGASADQVAALVSQPLERVISEIDGIKHVYAMSARGQSVVTAEFDVGQSMEPSLIKLYNKLAANMDKLPSGAKDPIVKAKGVDDVPMMSITLWSNSQTENTLRLVGLDLLQHLSSIPEVSQGFVVGGQSNVIKVEVLPERLQGYGIPLTLIAQTIRAANSELDVGEVEAWGNVFRVYTGSFLKSVNDVNNLIVGIRDGAPVFVADIARVSEGDADPQSMVRFYQGVANSDHSALPDGSSAVTIAFAKKHGTNGVSVAQQAIKMVNELKGRVIPDDIHVNISRDYGKSANEKVNELIFKLFVATGIVSLLVWYFLGWRPAVVVTAVIPVVILVTVFMAWYMDYTIDRVSLFALIFSIGILVDDAVVVLENIYRRWLLDETDSDEVAMDATAEVGNPTIIATLAVVAALMPMGFVRGMMGPYMEPIPALGSVAMMFSLFAAFAFTPWLAVRLKPSMAQLAKEAEHEHKQSQKLEKFFRSFLGSLLVEKVKGWGFLIGIIVAFALSVWLIYSTLVTVKLLPFDNKSDFSVVINFPEGTALPVTQNLANQLAKELQKVPEVVSLETYVGTAAPFDFNGLVRHYYLRQLPWQGDIQVHLLDKGQRERSSHRIAEDVRTTLTEIAEKAGARIQVVEMPPGPPVLQAVVAEIHGPDQKTREQVAKDIRRLFEKSELITDVDDMIQDPYQVWRFEVDTKKAKRNGISVDAINQTLALAMGGYRLGDVKEGLVREATFIQIQVPMSLRAEFGRLGSIPVASETGETIALAELGKFVPDVQQQLLFEKDLRPVVYVTGNTIGRLGAPVYGMMDVEEMLKDYAAPDGVTVSGSFLGAPENDYNSGFEWGGEWTVTYETFRDMGMAFGVALVLIYMLVVWEFKNFTIPLVVMAPIPLTLIGIIPGHWIMGAEFTATSMIGFIALAGIIVRNSILLVDFSRQKIDEGVNVVDSVIFACQARTRPIVITALALIAGSFVILFDPIFQGMAVSLIFGVFVSTALTLVVIPLGCVSAKSALCPHIVVDKSGHVSRSYDSGLSWLLGEEHHETIRMYSAGESTSSSIGAKQTGSPAQSVQQDSKPDAQANAPSFSEVEALKDASVKDDIQSDNAPLKDTRPGEELAVQTSVTESTAEKVQTVQVEEGQNTQDPQDSNTVPSASQNIPADAEQAPVLAAAVEQDQTQQEAVSPKKTRVRKPTQPQQSAEEVNDDDLKPVKKRATRARRGIQLKDKE